MESRKKRSQVAIPESDFTVAKGRFAMQSQASLFRERADLYTSGSSEDLDFAALPSLNPTLYSRLLSGNDESARLGDPPSFVIIAVRIPGNAIPAVSISHCAHGTIRAHRKPGSRPPVFSGECARPRKKPGTATRRAAVKRLA